MTDYKQLSKQVSEELDKLDKIKNWLIGLDKRIIHPDRFALLVKSLLNESEGDA